MFQYGGIKGYDQMVIRGKPGSESTGESNKWTKATFQPDVHKILVTQRHIYAVHLNTVIVLDTKPLSDVAEGVYISRKEFKIESHDSPVTCIGVEEASILICSCSDEHVFLSKWDSLLGHWDTKGISEDDGRILSCSIAFTGLAIYITLFKSDTLIMYKVMSAHSPTEPGPLILNSIECFTTLEKVKELTSWSKGFFFRDNFYIAGIASGNTVSLKLWEVVADNEQNVVKLKSHRMVSNFKVSVGADMAIENDNLYFLIVGNDGSSEIFSMTEDGLALLYRFKIEDPPDVSSSLNVSGSNSSMLNLPMSSLQIESRVLCAKLFLIKFPELKTPQLANFLVSPNGSDVGGDGDAKPSAFQEFEDEKYGLSPERAHAINSFSLMCPKLIVAAATTKGIRLVDIISGRIEMAISYGELLKDDNILIQNAQIAVDPYTREIMLGLQSCLTTVIFSRKFAVNMIPHSLENQTYSSLIPKEALSARSVLRKKIKSPPRQPIAYPVIKHNKPGFPRNSGGGMPLWARSRSRPNAKSSSSKIKISAPTSARSHSSACSSSSRGLLSNDSESLTARIINISGGGSYEHEQIPFQDIQKVIVPSSISHGISVLRIAATTSGKHLAFGSNLSPLVITKTLPFQSYRTFKDIGKVTSVHFNFTGNLLAVASSDCRTTLVDWHNSKELLSFEFTSKFNEHIHSQFYFMDKFIAQPEENRLVLYSYAKRDSGYIRLKAGEFQLTGQAITAMGAANQFYSNMIIAGLSNKTIQVFDTNAETISATISNSHSRPVSCIRINEAPKGEHATCLCDVFLTSSFSSFDPIKLWDIRSSKCIMRISDVNQATFVPTSRPNLSPCGRYIVSGFDDCSLSFYDVRNIKNRVCTIKKLGTTVLDCCFDVNVPMVWSGCRNGSVVNFYLP